MTRLVLVRHGETEWSKKGRHTGRTDVPLTLDGQTEARLVGQTLATFDIGAVFASPLMRALTTAQLAGFDPELDPNLMEWDYGEVEGLTNDQIVATNRAWSKWDDEVPGGEQVDDVGRRADRFLDRVGTRDHTVAVFAHGHFLSILIARWLDMSAREGKRFPLATGTVSILSMKRRDRVIEMVNHACGSDE